MLKQMYEAWVAMTKYRSPFFTSLLLNSHKFLPST